VDLPNVTAETRLRINDDEVAAEIVDGEAVVINLGTGMYYTLAGTGCEAWAMIEQRLTLAEMSETLATRYRVAPATVLIDLQRLAGELLDEGLVRVTSDAGGAVSRVDATSAPSAAGCAYAPPDLCRYTDMAEVLALDPPLPVLKDDA
jgi:hypothetical protein